jgi:hypothetical protein
MAKKAIKEVLVKTNAGSVPPEQEAVILSRGAGDTIRWLSGCDQAAVIVFATNDGSPFRERMFRLKAKGSVHSGPLLKKSRQSRGVQVYKYSIMGSAGNNDPIIIVRD